MSLRFPVEGRINTYKLLHLNQVSGILSVEISTLMNPESRMSMRFKDTVETQLYQYDRFQRRLIYSTHLLIRPLLDHIISLHYIFIYIRISPLDLSNWHCVYTLSYLEQTISVLTQQHSIIVSEITQNSYNTGIHISIFSYDHQTEVTEDKWKEIVL